VTSIPCQEQKSATSRDFHKRTAFNDFPFAFAVPLRQASICALPPVILFQIGIIHHHQPLIEGITGFEVGFGFTFDPELFDQTGNLGAGKGMHVEFKQFAFHTQDITQVFRIEKMAGGPAGAYRMFVTGHVCIDPVESAPAVKSLRHQRFSFGPLVPFTGRDFPDEMAEPFAPSTGPSITPVRRTLGEASQLRTRIFQPFPFFALVQKPCGS
jgi:hypothetical protein